MLGRMGLRDESGTALVMAVLASVLLSVLALSFSMVGILEGKIGINYASLVRALHIAEGGIEGVKRELIDLLNTNLNGGGQWTGTWTPVLQARGTCNGASVAFNATPLGGAAWNRAGSGATLFIRDNDGAPGVTWEDSDPCNDTDGIITIRADGRLATTAGAFAATKPLAVDISWGSENLWDGSVSGSSAGAGVILGNALLYGTVRLFQNAGGLAWDMGGGSGIRNNYIGDGTGSDALRATTRALLNPTLLSHGDVALNARFVVLRGTINFSGGATAGLGQGSVTNRKQTLDAALANDFDPAANSAIHADRTGPFSSTAAFPLLSSQVGAGDPRTWEQMLNQDGLHITSAPYVPGVGGGLGGNRIDGGIGEPSGPDQREFCVPYPCGTSQTVNGVTSKFNLFINTATRTATLDAQGIIVFDNFVSPTGLEIGKKTGTNQLDQITYTGSAAIFVDDGSQNNCSGGNQCAGNLTLVVDLVTPPGSYPTAVTPPVYPPAAGTVNTLGFMAERIGLARGADDSGMSGASQLTLAGLFYAQTQLYSCKQNEIFGSLVSRTVTMSCQVPKVAAVKAMSRFLPRGLIGSTPIPGTVAVIRWREGRQ